MPSDLLELFVFLNQLQISSAEKKIRLNICGNYAFLPFKISRYASVWCDDFLYFALHLNLSGKLDICGRAALDFKIFSNVALRVNIIAHPWPIPRMASLF